MLKSVGSVVAAAVIAGLIVFATAGAPQAQVADTASLQVEPVAKGDRLPAPVAAKACALQGWPHYESHCLHDNRASSPANPVRQIAMR